MKKVEAIIRKSKFSAVKEALHDRRQLSLIGILLD